jgi:hypothetical protein
LTDKNTPVNVNLPQSVDMRDSRNSSSESEDKIHAAYKKMEFKNA